MNSLTPGRMPADANPRPPNQYEINMRTLGALVQHTARRLSLSPVELFDAMHKADATGQHIDDVLQRPRGSFENAKPCGLYINHLTGAAGTFG